MSGPLCPPLTDAAGPPPAAQEGGVATAGPDQVPWRERASVVVTGALGVAGIALAGGAVSGLVGALAGGGAAAIAAAVLLRRMERLAEERRAWEARARAAEADRARAAADSRAKSLFLAEMSHELRTPLNTVMGFSEMMAQEVLGPHRVPAYAGYARDIHASGRHLLALADDLLDLARIEIGHRTLMETPVRLDQLAQDCLAMMRPQADDRALTLEAEILGEAPRLWGDERALRQIALNLLANAVKFTPPGGTVRLLAGLAGDGAPVLAVEDTGPGIAERELPLGGAHARESRLDVATGRGAGLGLAIVRGLATLHGASLTLTRRPGSGTRACVAFPGTRAMDTAG